MKPLKRVWCNASPLKLKAKVDDVTDPAAGLRSLKKQHHKVDLNHNSPMFFLRDKKEH